MKNTQKQIVQVHSNPVAEFPVKISHKRFVFETGNRIKVTPHHIRFKWGQRSIRYVSNFRIY